MKPPTIAMALIARDEEENIGPCLSSFIDHVDHVVLVDTGSEDATLARARKVAAEHDASDKLQVFDFTWIDDFAAARSLADEKARETGADWICWADADDSIKGAENLRQIAGRADDSTAAIFFHYDYARDQNGACVCELWRERLLRAGRGHWIGRVHEAQTFEGGIERVDAAETQWIHRKQLGEPTARNFEILERWAQDEPKNPRVLGYLATEAAGQNKHEYAVEMFKRYFEVTPESPEHLAQARRRIAASLTILGRLDEAEEHGLRGVREHPGWPDSYITLAEVALRRGEPAKAREWALNLQRFGAPQTLLIVNPRDYDFTPLAILAGAAAGLGRFDEAMNYAQQALAIMPGHPELTQAAVGWQQVQRRELTASSWLQAVEMLQAADENSKALTMIDCAPYFCADHPAIVAKRIQLKDTIAPLLSRDGYDAAYEDDMRPEDVTPDEEVTAIARKLPRAGFLKRVVAKKVGAEPFETRLGTFFTRPGDDMTEFLAMDGDEIDIEEIIRERVKPGMTVADIGANVGYFTRLLRTQVGESGEVHAVEPDPTNVGFLGRNNPQANVRVHPVAASDKAGRIALHLHPTNSGDNRIFSAPGTGPSIDVDVKRLETCLPKLDFAVIDCQGVDHLALEGLGENRPDAALVEMWPEGIEWAGEDVANVRERYETMGYDVTEIGDTSAGHWNLLLERAA